MSLLKSINPNQLAHAYVVEGLYEQVLSDLLPFLETKLHLLTTGNPDFVCQKHTTFTIELARDLKDRALRKTISKKIFILSFDHATHEAQNALLKLFEEPPQNTHFFMIVSTRGMLLPTLRSRCSTFVEGHPMSESDAARKFLSANSAKRLDMLKEIIEEKDKRQALNFLQELEAELYKENDVAHAPETVVFLQHLQRLKGYLGDRSPSLKMILEYVVIAAPKRV